MRRRRRGGGGEKEEEEQRKREWEGERISSRLPTECRAQYGAQSHDPEIMM